MSKRVNSGSKTVEKININLAKSTEKSPRKTKLERKTTIVVNNLYNESKEYEITYDDLKDHIIDKNLLGNGRFGVVWKFYHEPSRSTFAVKRISNSTREPNGMIMDLDVPIKLGNKCDHIVKFYGAIDAESYVWILNEEMDTSLDRFYLKAFSLNLKMEESFISKIAFSVLSALSYMKSNGFMHRDIKPSNILINRTSEIKVCDFGISGLMNNSVNFSYQGSQLYMPPEKINMTDAGYTIKADVWSLGITLIEIATNRHPFSDIFYMDVLLIITDEEQPSPKLPDNMNFTNEFRSFVDNCLFKDVKKRFDCKKLLEEEFIIKNKGQIIDLNFLKNIIDEIQHKNVTQ